MIYIVIRGHCQPNQSSTTVKIKKRDGRVVRLQKKPDESRNYQELIRHTACDYMNRLKMAPLDGPVEARVVIYRKALATGSKAIREARKSGSVRPDTRPDIDNQLKAILDGLNGVAFGDDGQVCRVHLEKRFDDGKGERVEITIRQWNPSGIGERWLDDYWHNHKGETR